MENTPLPVEVESALQYNISSRATPNFSTPIPHNAPVWPAGSKRLQLSPEEWEELKSTIQQLYIDEGKTFKEVALVLQTNYYFTPTYVLNFHSFSLFEWLGILQGTCELTVRFEERNNSTTKSRNGD